MGVLFADDTPVKTQAPGQKKTRPDLCPRWTAVVGAISPCAWYQFTIDRNGEHSVSHLSGCKGWVHADGNFGFNGLFGENRAGEIACMAHVRRKFLDVFATQDGAIAGEVIRRIAELYAVENEAPRFCFL